MAKILSTAICLFLLCLPVNGGAFCFEEAGTVHGISQGLLRSIARIESGMNAGAINSNANGTRDYGVMQINSAWIAVLELNADKLLSDPCYNVMTGARILKMCIERYGYSWEAVGCFNANSRNKRVSYSWKIFRELRKEKARNAAVPHKSLSEKGNKESSLYFRVRDADTYHVDTKP
ncbi:MAG: lytic transglycosylase domain-containing protein [Deltaproteobacteria bacterium]|nr:lytic transglycosylase domain-containing protein [Deltaproteobacteria bacterium]